MVGPGPRPSGFLDRMMAEVARELREGYYEARPAPGRLRPAGSGGFRPRLALRRSPAILVELKHRSPGEPSSAFRRITAPGFVARAESAEADGLSVLAQPHAFGGSLRELGEVAVRTQLPVLFKDFIRDRRQIEAAAAWGASAILLLARWEGVRTGADASIPELVEDAHGLGLEVLLELHGIEEIPLARKSRADLIGVNARDLQTLELDVGSALVPLAELARDGRPRLGLSGVEGAREMAQYRSAGVDGVLVGRCFLDHPDPVRFLKELRSAGGPV